MSDPLHWDTVYGAREEERLTWFEAAPDLSAELVLRHAPPGLPVLDVGGGASRLADRLLAAGRGPVTVLDLSAAALRIGRDRLGAAADFVVADVTRWTPDRAYGLWHDRAAFHFLTAAGDRAAYAATLDAALAPGGRAVVMTFAPEGPETCSGLPVCRYAPEEIAAEIGRHLPGGLRLVEGGGHVHLTPMENRQAFSFAVLARGDDRS